MYAEANKRLILRYFEQVWNQRDVNALDALFTPDVTARVSGHMLQGRDLIKCRLQLAYATYDDLHFTLRDLLADGDRVAARWRRSGTYHDLGSDQQVTITGMSFFRIREGRICDIWINADDLGELQQLGLLPLP